MFAARKIMTMKTTMKFLGIVFLSTFCLYCSKLTSKDKDALFCKKWKEISFEENGKKYNTPDNLTNNRIIFFPDHTVKSIQSDMSKIGVWSFDKKTKILTITDNETKFNIVFKVIEITEQQLIYQIGENNRLLTITLVPDLEK